MHTIVIWYCSEIQYENTYKLKFAVYEIPLILGLSLGRSWRYHLVRGATAAMHVMLHAHLIGRRDLVELQLQMRLVSLALLLRLKAEQRRCTGHRRRHIDDGVDVCLGLRVGRRLMLLGGGGYGGCLDVRQDLRRVVLFEVKVTGEGRSVFGFIRIGVVF